MNRFVAMVAAVAGLLLVGATLALGLHGVLRYETSPDHAHFHCLGFLRYELRHLDRLWTPLT
ncbi:MAG: hypothetical protein L0H84_13235 [Pseudonocardia sp.]|nr:hypothetical protein [Pseudonocardia sp.]